jgi:Protein of unknown function with HXXEE motif
LNPKSPQWLWLFAPAYFLHAIEELRAVGTLHGINLSLTGYIALSSVALLLMVIGIALAQRFRFPQLLSVCLATAFFVNGLSHIIHSVFIAGYDPGVVSGTVILIPVGIVSLASLWNSMSRLRYIAGITLGLAIQGIATILAW